MPSAGRFVSPYEGQWSRLQPRLEHLRAKLRRNPDTVVVALGIGVVALGVLIMVHAASQANVVNPAPPRVQSSKIVETNGSAPRAAAEEPLQAKAAANCQDQTWPYIARACLTRPAGSARSVRVISTDNVRDRIDTWPAAPTAAARNVVSAPRVANERIQQDAKVQQEPLPSVQFQSRYSADSRSADATTVVTDDARASTVREYNVPSHDNPARRKRVMVRQQDRHAVR